MTKIDIISGFLGAGKTTLIRKLLHQALAGQKIVLIENEFGQVGIDSAFLQDSGVQITEMSAGCICCSLVGDFEQALEEVLDTYEPERIIIEPSGVGKLSDVIRAVQSVAERKPLKLNSLVTVVDAMKYKMYAKNFGEFFLDQISHAGAIFLSRTDRMQADKLTQCMQQLRQHNHSAPVVTTPWDELDGRQLLEVMEQSRSLVQDLRSQMHEMQHDCTHDEGCTHDHSCGCSHHDHHHDAEEIFQSWGAETPKAFSKQQLADCLAALGDRSLGTVLRAKGIVPSTEGGWLHFNYVPGAPDIRSGAADYTGRLCVIGAGLDNERLTDLFGI